MRTANKAVQRAIYNAWCRAILDKLSNAGYEPEIGPGVNWAALAKLARVESYRTFRRRFSFVFDCWLGAVPAGFVLGIELDGYAHT